LSISYINNRRAVDCFRKIGQSRVNLITEIWFLSGKEIGRPVD
jgi:hypothetical protein